MSSRCETIYSHKSQQFPSNKKSPYKLIFTPGGHMLIEVTFLHCVCSYTPYVKHWRSWTCPLRAQSIINPGLIYYRSSFTGAFIPRPSASARAFAPWGDRTSPTHTTKFGVWL